MNEEKKDSVSNESDDDEDEDEMEKEEKIKTIKSGIMIKATDIKNNLTDIIYYPIRIHPSGYPQIISFNSKMNKTNKNKLVIPFNLPYTTYLNTFKMDINIYTSPLSMNIKSLESLIHEPYGCFEQTSSTVYPMILSLQYIKKHGIINVNITKKGYKYLMNGYKRLLDYQTKEEGGFEWFGKSPANEVLTSYGLMEFKEMKELISIDEEKINKAKHWLYSRQILPTGYFNLSSHFLDSFGGSGKDCNVAYIYWSLSEDLDNINNYIKDGFLKFVSNITITNNNNSYLLSLLGLTYYNIGMIKESNEIGLIIKNMFKDGHINIDEKNNKLIETITKSYGDNKIIETTCLSVLLLLKLDDKEYKYKNYIDESVEWLRKQNKNGLFGSTQSTILTLKVIQIYEEYTNIINNDDLKDIMVECYLNNEIISSELLSNLSDHSSLYLKDYSKYIKSNENEIVIESDKEFKSSIPLSVSLKYNSELPDSDKGCRVSMELGANKKEIKESEEIDLRIKIKNKVDEGMGMVVAVIGIPGGLRIRFVELKELEKRGMISSFEMKGNELILYWRGLSPNEEKEFVIHSNGEIPGDYKGSASYIYEYYNNKAKAWLDGIIIKIKH